MPDRLINALVAVVAEVRPFYLPAAGVKAVFVVLHGEAPWKAALVVGLAALNLWIYRDHDDDRWKRRRKKLAEKVARKGTRLVVVPAGA